MGIDPFIFQSLALSVSLQFSNSHEMDLPGFIKPYFSTVFSPEIHRQLFEFQLPELIPVCQEYWDDFRAQNIFEKEIP